jgi:magnesium-transporting ATPase (P-type)
VTPTGHGPTLPAGLDEATAARLLAEGLGNEAADRTTRTVAEIVQANLLTRFNAILGTLLAVILVVGPLQDALFGIVLVSNAAVGIFQELRAKRTLDRLAVLATPQATVRREGRSRAAPVEELVRGNVVELGAGDQLAVDGTVLLSEGLEVDEPLLSGETDPQPRHEGDEVLSGSFVVTGRGGDEAEHVGQGVGLDQARTTATMVLFAVAIWVLAILARPLDGGRAFLVASMVGAFVLLAALPAARELFALHFPPVAVIVTAIGVAVAANVILETGWRLSGWLDDRRPHQVAGR